MPRETASICCPTFDLLGENLDAARQKEQEDGSQSLWKNAARYWRASETHAGLSKCPDFVVNCGQYFRTSAFKEEPGLSDEDKLALIEFIKTFEF
jgi:hypothetical protein